MQTGSPRRIFVFAGLIALFVSYIGIWMRFIEDPVQRTGSDFIAFYTAGRIARQAGAAEVYDPLLQQQIQENEVGFRLVPGQVLLYNHLPFLLPILQITISSSYVPSLYRWVSLLVTLYIASIAILSRLLQQAGIDRTSVWLSAAGSLLFLPLFFSLMNGQDTAFLFLGVAIWMWGFSGGRDFTAGLGLSLATIRPHIALFLAIPSLFRSPRAFAGFLAGSGFLALISVLLLGPEGTRAFIDILLVSVQGEWYGMKENAMFNLIGLLTRAVPQLHADLIRLFGWGIYAATIITICVLWRKSRGQDRAPIGLSIVLALFTAPHLHFHDLALLLIPVYEWIRIDHETGSIKTPAAVALPIALSLLLFLSNLSWYLQYSIPYLILLMLGLYPYLVTRRAATTIPHRS